MGFLFLPIGAWIGLWCCSLCPAALSALQCDLQEIALAAYWGPWPSGCACQQLPTVTQWTDFFSPLNQIVQNFSLGSPTTRIISFLGMKRHTNSILSSGAQTMYMGGGTTNERIKNTYSCSFSKEKLSLWKEKRSKCLNWTKEDVWSPSLFMDFKRLILSLYGGIYDANLTQIQFSFSKLLDGNEIIVLRIVYLLLCLVSSTLWLSSSISNVQSSQ